MYRTSDLLSVHDGSDICNRIEASTKERVTVTGVIKSHTVVTHSQRVKVVISEVMNRNLISTVRLVISALNNTSGSLYLLLKVGDAIT